MRRHFSLATVLAALALLVAMSGTAWAAVVISSNHQVAKHTIAGANAPGGDNRNLIPGSVGRTDLHDGAVSGSKVADGSIGVGKLRLPRISFSGPDTDSLDFLPHHTLLSVDGVTLGVSCTSLNGGPTAVFLFVKSSTVGRIRGTYSGGVPNAAVTEQNVDDPVSASPFEFAAVQTVSGTELLDGQFVYFDSTRVITISLTGSATLDSSCEVHGTAVPAPN